MAQEKPQLKFERNPYNNFRDNLCHRRTDDGRTDDGRISISFQMCFVIFFLRCLFSKITKTQKSNKQTTTTKNNHRKKTQRPGF